MKHKIFTTANVIVTGFSSTASFFRLKIKPSLQCLAVVQRYFYNNLNIGDRKFVVRSVFELTIFNKFMTIVENQRKKKSQTNDIQIILINDILSVQFNKKR